MNRKSLRAALAASILGWSTTLVFAQQLGTAADARVMLDRAIVALKSNERTALSAFNDQNDKRFHDRDLYVFCFNMSDGKVTSYSALILELASLVIELTGSRSRVVHRRDRRMIRDSAAPIFQRPMTCSVGRRKRN